MITRVHVKRPAVPQVITQVRRGHHRDHHQSSLVPVPRPPAPGRKGPVVRAPARLHARPHPPQRGSSKLMQCLHIHFHPSQKRDLGLPPPRSSKHMSSQQVPPFPPPRGAIKPPRRHVHWAPAQAPLPYQPYPYPSNTSSGSSHARSHARSAQYQVPMTIPRYQPPRQSRGPQHLPPKRR
ncbi:hypothetical protein J3R82DRAFT_2364 [Butyriboletus roseoflavus]|nr:hypothetical protein J3R82DRAFT_2364 [Butyriboletus roseoflavus]